MKIHIFPTSISKRVSHVATVLFYLAVSLVVCGTASAKTVGDVQPLDLGHSMVEKGNELLKEGRKLVREGEEKISIANDQVRADRSAYRALLASEAPNADTARQVATLQDTINKNLDQIGLGNSMVERGEKLIAKGREQVRDGRATIESGYGKTSKTKRAVEFRLMLPEQAEPTN